MNWSEINEFISKYWQDALEILFFAIIFYYVSLWLRKDKQKNLLLYFYAYTLLFFGAYALQLPSIIFFMSLITPIVGIFFIAIHQETLQKNFISLAQIAPKSFQDADDWLELLVRSCLIAANNNRNLIILIEQKDNVASLITAFTSLQAHVQKNLINMLIESTMLKPHHMLWVNAQGKILGINAQWQTNIDDAWLNDQQKNLAPWHLDALLMTAKTDAIIFDCCPTTRTFSIISQGKLFNHIQSSHALKALKNYLEGKSLNLKEEKGAYLYGTLQQKNSSEQRTS